MGDFALHIRVCKEGRGQIKNLRVAQRGVVKPGGIDENDTAVVYIERVRGLD